MKLDLNQSHKFNIQHLIVNNLVNKDIDVYQVIECFYINDGVTHNSLRLNNPNNNDNPNNNNVTQQGAKCFCKVILVIP